MTLKAVLFDLDGTLLDTHKDLGGALNKTLVAHNKLPLPMPIVREHVSNGANALVKLGFGDNLSQEAHQTLRQQLLDYYLSNVAEHSELFDGMAFVLAQMTQHQLQWGIVTNKPRLYTEALLEALHFEHPPCVVVCPDDCGIGKPDPRPLLLACEQIAVTPRECLYVGDHKRDIDCAKAAGIQNMSVGFGFIAEDDDPQSWAADHHAQTVAELWPIIQSQLTSFR